jgi:serine protease AprX
MRAAVTALAVATCLASGAVTAGAADGAPACAESTARTRVIVKLAAAPAPAAVVRAVTRAVEDCGGHVLSVQPAVGTVLAEVPAGTSLGSLPGVLSVTKDGVAKPLALTFEPGSQSGSMTNLTRATGVTGLWKQGLTGAGVDVAMIDTGVAPVEALADPAKVVVGPDLSFESQDDDLRYLDTFGHGTHMGSIIAGRETPKGTGAAYAKDTKNFYGVAPDARLVSVKVGTHDGAVDVSQLIAAIDWVVQNRTANGLNIRVLNLSFGTDSTQSWTTDPLSQAAEVATRAGILVVAAGGNDGNTAGGLADPAYNPRVLAVGAADTKGTDSYGDDSVADFSQHNSNLFFARTPDLVAPGVRVVAPAVPGSTLAQQYPGALVGGGKYIRGSGTSQAAAFTSGVAALMYQKYPKLTPSLMRLLLMSNVKSLAWTAAGYEGKGAIELSRFSLVLPALSDFLANLQLNIPMNTATGTGTLQGARGSQTISIDGVKLTGERDIFDQPWSAKTLPGLTAKYQAWTLGTGTFNGSQWIGAGFAPDTATVAGQTWSGRTWSGRTWSGRTWSGRTWSGRTWSGRTWSGRTWSGGSWGDPVTPSGGWASRTWSGLWD